MLIYPKKNPFGLDWSPGLVVMGGESCSKVLGLDSHLRILDEAFFTLNF